MQFNSEYELRQYLNSLGYGLGSRHASDLYKHGITSQDQLTRSRVGDLVAKGGICDSNEARLLKLRAGGSLARPLPLQGLWGQFTSPLVLAAALLALLSAIAVLWPPGSAPVAAPLTNTGASTDTRQQFGNLATYALFCSLVAVVLGLAACLLPLLCWDLCRAYSHRYQPEGGVENLFVLCSLLFLGLAYSFLLAAVSLLGFAMQRAAKQSFQFDPILLTLVDTWPWVILGFTGLAAAVPIVWLYCFLWVVVQDPDASFLSDVWEKY